MKKAKSIDELYDEVKDYDLVMCNDAPLALALNNRLDKPHVGTFAITPRQLAGDLAMDILKEPLMSDIEIVRKVSDRTHFPLRYVHGEIENIKNIRGYTKDVKNYLHGWKSKLIFDEFIKLNSLEKVMDSFNGETDPFFSGKEVAVIGTELYNVLDKNFNPKQGKFEEIELFSDESESAFNIEEFRELYTDYQIAENAISLITEENAADCAIVLDVGGKIADIVRSELYRKGIPFINDLGIRDLNNIRDYIEFLNRSHNFAITKASQVRNLLQSFGGKLKVKCDEYLIEKYEEIADNERAIELFSIMKNIENYTYKDVCEIVMKDKDAQVKLMLTQLGLITPDGKSKKVNLKDTSDIVYSVDNFPLKHNEQIPKEEKKGVLIVDCKNSVYIDRPFVIYLGMGQEWEKDLSHLNLLDSKFKDREVTANTAKFQILMQQGTARIYICNSKKKGKDAKPCRYFEYANNPERPYKTFSDITKCVPGAWYEYKGKEWNTAGMQSDNDLTDFTFSPSSFNSYVKCPKLYIFQSIVDYTDKDSNALGNYLHSYAEFKACFPEETEKMGTEFFINYISEKCVPLFSPEMRKLMESKIRFAIYELDKLIEEKGVKGNVYEVGTNRYPNPFFEMIGKGNYKSDCNEVEYENRYRHMFGKMDLVSGSDIYDFKTGSPKKAEYVIKGLSLSAKSDYGPDVQSLFYLSLLSDNGVENPTFTLYSTSANQDDWTLGNDIDPEKAQVHVKLVDDITFIREYLPFYTYITRYDKYNGLLSRWDRFIELLKDYGIDNAFSDPSKASKYFQDEMALTEEKPIDIFKNVLKYADKVIKEGLKQVGNTIFITKGRLDVFRDEVMEKYESYKKFYNENTNEITPLMECSNCYNKDMCTLFAKRGDSE